MKVLSLFDGISCARVAMKKAGIPVDVYYASEVDKYAIQIAQKNWPDTVQLGDVTTISERFYLNPVECERLQSIDDRYTEGVSDAQRYKMCGNAFNADVVAHILSFLHN